MTASGHSLSQIQENLKDITECSICKETFRDPRILPCIHTFCKKCLEATASESSEQPGSTMPCPMCRHEFVVPAKGVDELQKNFFMVKLIDMKKHLASSVNPPLCDVCPEDNADTVSEVENTLAELFCRNCTLRLCSNCVRHHKRSKLTSTHVLVQLDDCSLVEKMSEILVPDECEKHDKELLKLHCTDCQVVVCALCFIEEHSNHKWSEVGKAAEKFRQRIKTDVEILSKENSKLNSKKLELENMKIDNNRHLSDLELAIRKRKSLLQSVIDKHANSLIEELGMRRKENLKEIKLEEENIELQLANQRSYADYCLELAANGSAVDICLSEKDLNARADDLHRLCQSLCQRTFEPLALRCNMPTIVDEFVKNKDKNFIGEICKGVKLLGKELDATKMKLLEASRGPEYLEDLQKIMDSTETELKEAKREIEILKEENKILKQELKHSTKLECLASEFSIRTESCIIVVGFDNNEEISQDVMTININGTNEVSTIGQLPPEMQIETAAAVYGNSLFVTGLEENCDKIWKLDARSSKWEYCNSMIRGRRRHSVAFVDHVLYICGGWADDGEITLDDIGAYDTIDDRCTTVGKLVQAVQSAGNCVPFKSSLYIFGGCDADDENVDYIQVYDTKLDCCTLISKRMPVADRLLRAVSWDNKAILLTNDRCLIYNFDTGTWQMRDQFKTDVIHFGMIVHNGKLFVIGGGDLTEDETWICRDDVRSVPVANVLNNESIEWQHHAKLPEPSLVQSFGKMEFLVQ